MTTLEELQVAVLEMRAEIDSIRVKRDQVMSAMEEIDVLQDNVIVSAKKIKKHLKEAL